MIEDMKLALRCAKAKQGLTNRRLAELTGYSLRQINRAFSVKAEDTPSIDLMEELFHAMGLSFPEARALAVDEGRRQYVKDTAEYALASKNPMQEDCKFCRYDYCTILTAPFCKVESCRFYKPRSPKTTA